MVCSCPEAPRQFWPLRAPPDVLNLKPVFLASSNLRKNCLSSTPEAVVIHAATRRHTHRAAIAIIPTEPAKQAQSTDMPEDFVSSTSGASMLPHFRSASLLIADHVNKLYRVLTSLSSVMKERALRHACGEVAAMGQPRFMLVGLTVEGGFDSPMATDLQPINLHFTL